MVRRFPSLFILYIFLIAGCLNKEDKISQKGVLKLGKIELLSYDSGAQNNERVQENSLWNHIFKSQATVIFKNTLTQEEFSLVYDPNEFSSSDQLTLPYGDYSYHSEVIGNDYENHLPYLASGTFRLNSPTLEISLKSESSYGLITVENSNINPKPQLVDNQQIPMNLAGDFYYKYVKKGKVPVLEIIENVFQNTFRRSITVEAYKHYNYVVRISDGSGKIINLLMTDFELMEEVLLVNVGEVPAIYSPTFLTVLQEEINQSSGLARFDGKTWTINDSGNEPIIYQINSSLGTVEKKIKVSNALNVDWESMAQSDTHLFIGDFGNNRGNRKDLTILKIAKKNLLLNKSEVEAEKIMFTYPDQSSFVPAYNNNNFDCEAFFFANDSLHLFSKNWVDNQTRYYTLSSSPGNYEAKLKADFDVQGLITAADINPFSGNIVLLGYTNSGLSSRSFVWLFSGYRNFKIFEGKKSRIDIGSPAVLGQTEGIYLDVNNSGFISSERIQLGGFTVSPQLYRFDFNAFF